MRCGATRGRRMSAQTQAGEPEPHRRRPRRSALPAGGNGNRRTYGRPQRLGAGAVVVMVSLRPDAAAAVLDLVRRHNLSRSGAAHHLIRLGAGLDPLPPLN